MSAAAAVEGSALRSRDAAPAVTRLALLGTGTVGSALLQRLAALQSCAGRQPCLVHLANSRRQLACPGGLGGAGTSALAGGSRSRLADVAPGLRGDGLRVLVDATASEEVADWHAGWLAQGIHVVTANKLGAGGPLSRWLGIRAAAHAGGTLYGDSATVGAGLPILRTLRDLQSGGDRIHAISGLLSGSLSWLCNRFDASVPFSRLVEEAREAGFTEPDPRIDLSGEDVRRKLLILARNAGFGLESEAVQVTGLLPAASAPTCAGLDQLDAPMRNRLRAARAGGGQLRFVARLSEGSARVGLETLGTNDPLAGGEGTVNRVAIWSDRYREQPLVIQGPGAGAWVTAAALLDDVLRIAAGGCAGHGRATDLRHARGHA